MLKSNFIQDERGTIAIVFALTATIAIGVTGAAVDYARALSAQTAMQQAADAAAISAASLTKGTDAQKTALAEATFNANYDNGSRPAATTSVAVSGKTVIVTGTASVPTTLSALLGVSTIEIRGAGQAAPAPNSGARTCILALDPSGDAALLIQGNAGLHVTDCAVQANSDHATAIKGNGNPTASATSFCAKGGTGGSHIFTPTPTSGCSVIDDPFADVATPSYSGCKMTNKTLKKGSHSLSPGVYCGGLKLNAGANVSLSRGTYFIKDGPLSLRGGSSINGSGVVFVFVGNNAILDIRGGSDADLKAPSVGKELEGFLFFQDGASSVGLSSVVSGGGSLKMNGMAYFPTQTLEVRGNGQINQNADMWAIVAYRILLSGTPDMYVMGDADGARLPDLVPLAPSGVVLN